MRFSTSSLTLSLIAGLLAACATPSFAEDDLQLGNGEVKVTADRMISRSDPKVIYFSGNVHAVQEEVHMNSRELTVTYPQKSSAVEKILAERNVLITSPTRRITGDRADMFPQIKKIVITGNATLEEENEDVKGEKIIYFYGRDDIIISGGSNNRAKLKLKPARGDKNDE